MSKIEVGDFVTWGNPRKPHTLKFTGCQVIELGESDDGKPAARLDLGRFGEANAYVDDLVKE